MLSWLPLHRQELDDCTGRKLICTIHDNSKSRASACHAGAGNTCQRAIVSEIWYDCLGFDVTESVSRPLGLH